MREADRSENTGGSSTFADKNEEVNGNFTMLTLNSVKKLISMRGLSRRIIK